jgi:hypothetical protein
LAQHGLGLIFDHAEQRGFRNRMRRLPHPGTEHREIGGQMMAEGFSMVS